MACQPALTDGLRKEFCIDKRIIDGGVLDGNLGVPGGETPRQWGINSDSYVRASSDAHAQTLIEAQSELGKQFKLSLQFIHCDVYGEQAWVDAGLPPGEFNQSFLDQMTSTEHDRIAVTRAAIKTVESDFMTDVGGTERQSGGLYWAEEVTVGAYRQTPAEAAIKIGEGAEWERRVYYGIIDAFRENNARINSECSFYYAQYLDRDQVSEMASMNTDTLVTTTTETAAEQVAAAVASGEAAGSAGGRSLTQLRDETTTTTSAQESIAGQTGQQVKTCMLDATCDYRTAYDWALEKYKDYFALRVYQHLAEQEDKLKDDAGKHGVFDPEAPADELEAERELAKKLAQAALAITAGVAPELDLAGYREQCFLLSNLDTLVGYRWKNIAAEEVKPLPYVAPPAEEGVQNYVGNACLEVVGDTFSFMNKLTQYPTQLALFKARAHQLSSLQPMIRLFKLSEDANGVEFEQEFNFEGGHGSMWPTDFLKNKDVRGYGVGIKDFSFTYDGSNPFAVKKSIKATLKIFANNFDELLKIRGNYRYIDLALKTGGGVRFEQQAAFADPHDELDKLNFRLKAVVGWAEPPGMDDAEFWNFYNMNTGADQMYGTEAGGQVRGLKEAIKHSYVTLNLTPTVHDFAFDEMGRVTFTINYLAYIEDFFDQSTFNIFSDVEIGGRMLARQLTFNRLSAECDSDAISQFKESEQNNIKNDKVTSLQTLLGNTVAQGKIRYLNLSYDELIRWQKMGAFSNLGETAVQFTISEEPTGDQDLIAEIHDAAAARESGDELGEPQWSTERINDVLNSTEKQQLPYFYVFNLVDEILAGIENYLTEMPSTIDTLEEQGTINAEEEEAEKKKIEKFKEHFKNFRAVLGPIEIVSPKDPSQKYLISLGDLPVSVKFFIDWLTEKLLQKEESVYPLPMFLNDFFNVLIRNYLNDDTCFKVPIKQRVRMSQTSLTDYASADFREGIDTLTAHTWTARAAAKKKDWPLIVSDGGAGAYLLPENASPSQYLSFPVLNIAGPEGSRGFNANAEPPPTETNYLIYYGGRTTPKEAMNGDVEEDHRRGIMHYIMGEDVGIVKKIDLKKTSSPGLKEVRFEQEGYDGLKQLREVYDADITTFADVGAFPGKYIFVDPRGFAPQTAGVGDDKRMDLTEFGVGGYYMIYRSEHSFGPGKAESRVSAKWVAERTGTTRTAEEQEAYNEEYAINRPRPSKCDPHAGGAPAGPAVLGQGDPTNLTGDRTAADTVSLPNEDIYASRAGTAAGPSGADVIPRSGTEK